MKAELVPDNGDPPIPITRDVTVVGRREYCDVKIADPSLSKRHCVLVKTDGLLLVRDLATTNGTKVKGQRVRWAALLPDDRLTLGAYKCRVYLGPDDVPGPSEASRGASRSSPARRPSAVEPEPLRPAPREPAQVGFGPPSPLGTPALRPDEFWEEDESDDSGWRDEVRVDLCEGDVIIDLD
jgi:predicted component of type VI protein secretion system